jgi:Kef-type K+ transport system membrane component KefB
MQEQFFVLFTIVCGAATVPFLARRLRMPSAVLEILYGVFLFNVVLHSEPEWFLLLKELGFIYLMFIAGMELDLRELLQGRRFCWYLLIPGLSFLVIPFLFVRMGYSFYLGIAVSIFSAGIIIPVLKESDLLETPWGRDVIGIGLTGELLSIAVLTGIDVYSAHGLTIMALVAGLKLLLLLVLSALFLRLLYVIAWWNPERVQRVMESKDPVEEGIRAVVAVAFAGALIAYGSGVEPILGSFMAGLIFSIVFKSKERFEEKINAVGFGFFTPFFFIGVGADLDLALFKSPDALLLSLLLTVMVFISNLAPVLLSRPLKITTRESLAMALLLSAPLSLIVVAGALGRKLGLLSPETGSALILTAILSGVIYPYLFRLTFKKRIAENRESFNSRTVPGLKDRAGIEKNRLQ